MKTFYKQSTYYYMQSSELFHRNLVHSPALFFVSKTDPVGTLTNNMRVRKQWDSLGVKVNIYIYEKMVFRYFDILTFRLMSKYLRTLHMLDTFRNIQKNILQNFMHF